MVRKSKGSRRGTRSKFRSAPKFTVNKFLKKFVVGEKAAIVIDPSSQKGMPFRRFHGLTGKVCEKRGNSYLVEIKDGKKFKKIVARPEHLKKIN